MAISIFNTEPEKKISVLLPTRGRSETAHKSLLTLAEHADDLSNFELLVAVDSDDQESINYFTNVVTPDFEQRGIDLTVFVTPRWGYGRLNEYINFLASASKGAWIIFWNDDALMESDGWDTEVIGHTGEFKVLAFTDNHDGHPYAIFPIIPRDWVVLFETVSPQQQSDAWISQVAYLSDCWERIKTRVIHDRHDLTGNNNDEIYQTRVYHEGNQDNPLDINHPKFHSMKQHWAAKVVWLRKLLGQDTGWWDKVLRGEQDPWEKMLSGAGSKHIKVMPTKKKL